MRRKIGISKSKNRRKRKSRSSRRTSFFGWKKKRSPFKYRKLKKYKSRRKGSKKARFNKLLKGSKFKKTASKALGIVLGIGILATLGGTIFLGATLASIKRSLPDPDQLLDRKADESTKIYDRGGPEKGTLLYTIYGEQNREFRKIEDIPEHTKWAVLAAEDVEFYDHKGLDMPGIAKAAYQNLVLDQTRGASTISQQLVRNTLLYDFLGEKAYERTLMRKGKEALITMQLEQTLTKDEILQMYLNEIPLGGTNYGFQAAAKAYFDKDVEELTLAESAMLAGIIQAPGYYSPLYGSNPDEMERRQDFVLNQMYEKREYIQRASKKYGKEELEITEEMIKKAKETELEYKPADIDIKAPHFVFYVKQKLIEKYGQDRVQRGGLTVTTTLDYDIQQIAQEEIVAGVDKYRGAYNVHNGSMVVMDPRTTQVLALVGSYDYFAEPDPKIDGNVNIATSLRQMGSSVKPYTYLTAFHKGYNPGTTAPDIPFDFGYEVDNWDGKYKGIITARRALVDSRNIPALYTLQLAGGVDEFIKTAETLGVTTLTQRDRYGLSLTLGAGEMKLLEHTGAFSAFANNGKKHEVTPILKVQDREGEVLEKYNKEDVKRVWDEKEIYLLNWVLCDMSNQGRVLSKYYSVGNQRLCGKTGTTNGPRDLTAFLYYPNLVVGVWAGNNNNDVTIGAQGQAWSTTVPLPIAHSFMTRVVGKYGEAWYSRPGGIKTGTVCIDSGMLAKSSSPCKKESSVFIQGHVPKVDDVHLKKPICKENGLIATNESEAKQMGLIEYKTYVKISLPVSQHQSAFNSWMKKYEGLPPASEMPNEGVCPLHLNPGNKPTIEILSPTNGTSFSPGDNISFTVNVNSLGGVSKVEYYFDGSKVATANQAPYSTTYQIPAGTSSGSHTVTAKVYDSAQRSSDASVQINVNESTNINIDLTSPSAGTITMPQNLQASVSGDYGQISSLNFVITGAANSEINASSSDGGQTWTATWDGGTTGNYWIHAEASTSGGSTFSSEWIQVQIE
jgi:membrane peptidoglycan carboxypeptidase